MYTAKSFQILTERFYPIGPAVFLLHSTLEAMDSVLYGEEQRTDSATRRHTGYIHTLHYLGEQERAHLVVQLICISIVRRAQSNKLGKASNLKTTSHIYMYSCTVRQLITTDQY